MAERDQMTEIVTLEGTRVPVQIGRAWVHGAMRFRPTLPGWTSVAEPQTCGEVLDAVTRLIAAAPDFITDAARARHLTFIEHLSRVMYEDLGPGFLRRGPLRSTEIGGLHRILALWVENFLTPRAWSDHPLATSWALETAVAIVDLAFGARLYGDRGREPWEIEGLLTGIESEGRLESPQMKREITRGVRGTAVLVEVPSSGRVMTNSRDTVVFHPGELFIAIIDRCHLSTGVADYIHFECDESVASRYDLDARFRFRSGLAPAQVKELRPASCEVELAWGNTMPGWLEIEPSYMPFGEIPGDWIVAAVDAMFGKPLARVVPMSWKPLVTR